MKTSYAIFLIVIIIVNLTLITINYKLPPIMLPVSAQHNTIGELPLVEVMDDGNFYEKDGKESVPCKKSWDDRLRDYCKDKKGKAKKKCLQTIPIVLASLDGYCYPGCEEMNKIGAIWTCNNRNHGGGIGWK